MKKSLKIPLNTIPEAGRDLSLDLGKEWFAHWQEEDPDLEFSAAAITGHVQLAKHGRDILVRGHLQGEQELACSRCLEAFGAPVAIDFDLLLVPGPEPVTGADEELTAPDLDLDYYAGDVMDLNVILREQIILMVPLKPLCAEDCRGLCPHCGGNLNRETCQCHETDHAHSPFAALAKVKR